MNLFSLFKRALALSAILLVAASTWMPAEPSATPPEWLGAAHAGIAFLQQQSVPTVHAASSGGGAPGIDLPTSVFNHSDPKCSAETSDTPPLCSVVATAAPGTRCSSHCDSRQQCSSFLGSGGVTASCSTQGAKKTACSTLLPPFGGVVGESFCSTFGGLINTRLICSVLADGKKQGCSAENASSASFNNKCSSHGSGPGFETCSVFAGTSPNKKFCSTFFNGPKQCSTFGTDTDCSVNQGKAVCTALLGAPAGSCSMHATPSHCSVVFGSAGTLCNLP